MNPNASTVQIVTHWVTNLADVCAHSDGKPSSNAIAAYAAVLAQTLPSGAFTVQSLAHVTDRREWFPAVGIVSAALAEWWNDHKPRSAPAITDGRAHPAGWEDADQNWVDFWHKRRGEMGALDDRRQAEMQYGRLASLVRQQSPRAAQFLGLTDPLPADDIVRRVRQPTNMPAAPRGRTLNRVDVPHTVSMRDVSLSREQLDQTHRQSLAGASVW